MAVSISSLYLQRAFFNEFIQTCTETTKLTLQNTSKMKTRNPQP
jgi:hypothetical protein